MPQERLAKHTQHAKVSGNMPVRRPWTRWLNYIENLVWNRLGLYPSEMPSALVDREVRRFNVELLPPQPSRKSD